jgi:crotonobetainyl-CoA:carnitine CoA-transferase CaiB-like acyl-CoA transferase
VYACKGGGFYSVGALEPKFWGALCIALDRPDLVGPQFAEGSEGEAVHREMEAVFASRTRSEWERALAGLDVCCEPVLDLDEVASHPQIAARQLIAKRNTGVEVRPAVQLRSDWRRLDPPGLGEHSAEILAEVGVDAIRLEELKAQGVI